MLRSLLPTGSLEFLLFAVMVGAFVLVVRSVRNRRAFVAAPYKNDGAAADEAVPFFATPLRVRGTVRRVLPDKAQDALVVEIQVGKKRLVFRPNDAGQNTERYQNLTGQKEAADFAVYALATLAPGGAEAMRHQIKDWDVAQNNPDLVGLFPAGQFANDCAVIARIKACRDETIDGEPVWVYRAQVHKTADQELFLELAASAESPLESLPTGALAHGSARLFGGFAND